MELRQLNSFRTIAATGSFGSAADRMGLTQSALSHQIRNLEEELGMTLIVRAKPQVYLTEAGQYLLSAAEKIFDEIDEVRVHFGLVGESEEFKVLRVAATSRRRST